MIVIYTDIARSSQKLMRNRKIFQNITESIFLFVDFEGCFVIMSGNAIQSSLIKEINVFLNT